MMTRINGTDIKNEKRADFSLSTPNRTDVEIVAPEREIPGNIAIACDIPITTEPKKLTFFLVGFALSARYRSIAVIISMNPTSVKFQLKRVSISFSQNIPTNAAGIIDKIDKFLLSNCSIDFIVLSNNSIIKAIKLFCSLRA